MPTIELTEGPPTLVHPNARLLWWKALILAHSFYPAIDATDVRIKFAEWSFKNFAKDWITRTRPIPWGAAVPRWMDLYEQSLTGNEIAEFKRNEGRDLAI